MAGGADGQAHLVGQRHEDGDGAAGGGFVDADVGVVIALRFLPATSRMLEKERRMFQVPNVVGLTLCEEVITDTKSRNLTLVNAFSRLRCSRFPSPPQRLAVCTTLTDGLGDGTMSLMVSRLDTLEVIAERDWRMRFTDPLRTVRLILRFSDLSFPTGGAYQFSLSADGEWIAQTVLQVISHQEK